MRSPEEVVREHFITFARKDWEGFANCFTDDVRLYAGLATLHLQWQGKEALRRMHKEFFTVYDDPKFNVTCLTVQGTRVVAEYHWSVTEKATGKRLGVQRVEVFETRSGSICEVRVYSLLEFRELPTRRRRFQFLEGY